MLTLQFRVHKLLLVPSNFCLVGPHTLHFCKQEILAPKIYLRMKTPPHSIIEEVAKEQQGS